MIYFDIFLVDDSSGSAACNAVRVQDGEHPARSLKSDKDAEAWVDPWWIRGEANGCAKELAHNAWQ